MKATGMVREIDRLGRIVLPIEIRKKFDIKEKDPMEIYTDDNGYIVIKKYEPACFFCKTAGELVEYYEKKICRDCLNKLKEL